MKTIITILLLTLSSFAKQPNWVNKETIWRDSGKVYIKINVVSNDLDIGMNSTKSRFIDIVKDNFCPNKEDLCTYYNFTIEGSYWEVNREEDSINYNIYRLFSIWDVYHH